MWMVLVMLIIALALSGIFLWIKYSIKKSEEKKALDLLGLEPLPQEA